jgi:hypothetical protein
VRPAFTALVIVAGAIGVIAPAFAAQNMSAAPMLGPGPAQIGGDAHHHDGDDGRHHDGHPGQRTLLWPFGFYQSAQAPTVITVDPEAPTAARAPPAPEAPAAEPPPCRETTADGVVIIRGLGCTSEKQ